jgi:hypothetical protein
MNDTTAKHPTTDAEFQAEILRITRTKCLPWLQEWCQTNKLSRTNWADLYRDIICLINGTDDRNIRQEVFCCIREEILEIERESAKTCHMLGWVVIESTNGLGSHEIFDGNILLETIFQYGNGFTLYGSKDKYLHGDIYSAALSLLPKEILEYKIRIRELELNLAIES